MILTLDYTPVRASFDRAPDFQREVEDLRGDKRDSGSLFYNFQVGPLEYRVDLEGHQGTWDASFFLNDIKGSREELAQYFTKAFRRPISPFEVPGMKRYLLSIPIGKLKLGNPIPVFAGVLGIIKQFVDNYTVNCLTLHSDDDKKARVYRRLIKTHLSGWSLALDNGSEFKVCKNQGVAAHAI